MQKLAGVKIYRNLIFNVSSLGEEARKRLSVLARLANLLSIKQRRVLINPFIESLFSCFPLIWIFDGRVVIHAINLLHELSIHVVCKNDHNSSKVLKRGNSFAVQHRNNIFTGHRIT